MNPDAFALMAPLAAGDASVSLLRHFVIDGGPITWFALIPLSVISIALAIHYFITIRRATQTPPALARSLVASAKEGQLRGMIEMTRGDGTMLGQAAYAGLSHLGNGREAAMAAIDEAVEERVGHLFRRVEYLNVIGNVSPMIGLLGTVVGMIQAFQRIYAAGGAVPEASKLVGDIAIALVNTFWGLFIAIPALSAYAFFRNRIDAFAAESVKLCDGVIALTSEGDVAPSVMAAAPIGPADGDDALS